MAVWAAARARAHTALTELPIASATSRAVVVLGRDVDDAAAEASDLDSTGVPVDLDDLLLPLELVAMQARNADTERTRLLEDRRSDVALVDRPRESGQDDTRAPLLHLSRHRPDVEGAGGDAALDGIRHELGVEVVEVRLEQGDRGRPGRDLARPEQHPHDVRAIGELTRSCPVAHPLEHDRRAGSPTPDVGGREGGARSA